MTTLVDKDNGRTVDLHVGDAVRIVLPENATTGYRWTIDHYDSELIEPVATAAHYTSNALGAGGNVEFIFKSKKPGKSRIALKEWRQWEGDASITNRFDVGLNIERGS